METRAHRIRLKPGSLPRVRERAAELTRRRAEVIATMRDETVGLECFFLATDRRRELLDRRHGGRELRAVESGGRGVFARRRRLSPAVQARHLGIGQAAGTAR